MSSFLSSAEVVTLRRNLERLQRPNDPDQLKLLHDMRVALESNIEGTFYEDWDCLLLIDEDESRLSLMLEDIDGPVESSVEQDIERAGNESADEFWLKARLDELWPNHAPNTGARQGGNP